MKPIRFRLLRLAGLFVIVLAVAVFGVASLSSETKSALLVKGVGVVERVLRRLEFKRAYQPFYKRVREMGFRGFRNRDGGMEASGEAGAARFFKTRLLQTPRERLVFFDGGAFHGEYTDVLLGVFDGLPRVEVHAFEPASASFAFLQGKFGGDARVRLVHAALGDVSGTLSLRLDSAPEINSFVARPYLGTELPTETVEVKTLDDYCAASSIERIHVLKLDVEGYERNVLNGAKRLLAENRIEIIQFEYGELALANHVLFHDLYALLSPRFDLYRVVGDGLEPIPDARAAWEEQAGQGGNYVALLRL